MKLIFTSFKIESEPIIEEDVFLKYKFEKTLRIGSSLEPFLFHTHITNKLKKVTKSTFLKIKENEITFYFEEESKLKDFELRKEI